jgi:hypothetical protein
MGVVVEGLEELRADIAEAAAMAADPRPALEEWAADLEALVDRAFASQTTPEGRPWAPRRMTTRSRVGGPEHPRRRVPGRPLGVDSGAMRASIDVQVAPRAVVLDVGAQHASFFTRGTRYQPARPFVPTADEGASASALDDLAETLADYATEALRG